MFEYSHLGYIIILDGRQLADTHIERVITHGNALMLMERLQLPGYCPTSTFMYTSSVLSS